MDSILYDGSINISSDGTSNEWKGDFLGFTFGGVHSSSLGIVRVSDSDRYTEDLKPNESDVTATVPGFDGTYYFGTTYTQKPFTVKFAFDNLTDSQIRKIRQVFSNKKPQDLIFDETPYKVYTAKVKDVPNLTYLCFDDETEKGRIYKGEGTVNFIAYTPFARSRYKYSGDYTLEHIPEWTESDGNKTEWLESSGIVNKSAKYSGNYYHSNGTIDVPTGARIQLYNPGDVKTSSVIICNTSNFFSNSVITINKLTGAYPTFVLVKNYTGNLPTTYPNSAVIGFLSLNKDKINSEGIKSILIDNKKHLIYASKKNILSDDSQEESENDMKINSIEDFMNKGEPFIFNQCICGGDFFDIPTTEQGIVQVGTTKTLKDSLVIGILNPPRLNNSGNLDKILIFYDYLYY